MPVAGKRDINQVRTRSVKIYLLLAQRKKNYYNEVKTIPSPNPPSKRIYQNKAQEIMKLFPSFSWLFLTQLRFPNTEKQTISIQNSACFNVFLAANKM